MGSGSTGLGSDDPFEDALQSGAIVEGLEIEQNEEGPTTTRDAIINEPGGTLLPAPVMDWQSSSAIAVAERVINDCLENNNERIDLS